MKRNLKLAVDFAKRDFKQRYIGTSLGQLWYVISPIITIFIYTVIFSDFMKMKLDIIDSAYSYSIYLVPAILAWVSFSTIITRMINSFSQNANLIKKLNVPMYTFQLSIAITELFLLVVSMILGVCFLILVGHPVNLTFFWLFPVLVLQTIFAFALGVIFSLFTPFFKDIRELIPVIIQLWFWMTPIVYLKDMVYNKYPYIIDFNPFFYYIDIYRNIFLYSKTPSFDELFLVMLLPLISIVIAGFLYKKMISTIKDII